MNRGRGLLLAKADIGLGQHLRSVATLGGKVMLGGLRIVAMEVYGCCCKREASTRRARATIRFYRTAMGTKPEQYRLQINNDKIARWLLGDNAAEGTIRLLVLILAYIVSSVLALDGLMR